MYKITLPFPLQGYRLGIYFTIDEKISPNGIGYTNDEILVSRIINKNGYEIKEVTEMPLTAQNQIKIREANLKQMINRDTDSYRDIDSDQIQNAESDQNDTELTNEEQQAVNERKTRRKQKKTIEE